MSGTGQLAVYRGCTPVVDEQFERDGTRTLTQALVHAIAEAEGVDPTDLPPLYEAVDVDALSQLFDRHRPDNEESLFSFRVSTWNVFVRGDGRIRVCDATRLSPPEPVFETPLQ